MEVVLVFGATGRVGGCAFRRLLEIGAAKGVTPVAVVRNKAKAEALLPSSSQIAVADLSDTESLLRVCAETKATRAFIYAVWNKALKDGMKEEVAALVRGGVKHIVFLSSFTADPEWSQGLGPNEIHTVHENVEGTIRASGVTYTMLRGGVFASNTVEWKHQYLHGGKVYWPYATVPAAVVVEEDLGALAAAALSSHDLDNASPFGIGAELLAPAEQVQIISEVTGVPAEIVEVSPEQFREKMGPFMPASMVDALLGALEQGRKKPHSAFVGGAGDELMQKVAGRPSMRFREWVEAHKAELM